ncbi:hypothetical protein REPUB_Repub13aG0234200 [Reevesia pubescens]
MKNGNLAAGGVCRDDQGQWIFGFTRRLGTRHVTKVEIFAIYSGMKLAWEHGCRKIMVESDSQLAVKKILGPISDLDPLGNILHSC